MKKSYSWKTEKYYYQVEQVRDGWMAQCTDRLCRAADPHGIHHRTHILEVRPTVEAALNELGYPVEILGVPEQLR